MTDRLRLGIVGAGAIVQVGHLPALRKIKEIEVVGVCDNDMVKARALADRFDIPDVYPDLAELVELGGLDALLVCTPNHLHEPHVLSGLSAGLHVLAERPLALTPGGVQKITRAQQKRDCIVMTGANHRYRPDVQTIRSFIQSGELGDLESIRAWWFLSRTGRGSLGWRQRRDQAGGGGNVRPGPCPDRHDALARRIPDGRARECRLPGEGQGSRAERHRDAGPQGRQRNPSRCLMAVRGTG